MLAGWCPAGPSTKRGPSAERLNLNLGGSGLGAALCANLAAKQPATINPKQLNSHRRKATWCGQSKTEREKEETICERVSQ